MYIKSGPNIDPITAQMLRDEMRLEKAKRNAFKPQARVRRPWQGTVNWEGHKRKLENKRRAANKVARQTRKAQRRASRA